MDVQESVFLSLFVLLLFVLAFKQDKKNKENQKKIESNRIYFYNKYKIIEEFELGVYLFGLPNYDNPSLITCGITDDRIILFKKHFNLVLGKKMPTKSNTDSFFEVIFEIPACNFNEVRLEDVTKTLTKIPGSIFGCSGNSKIINIIKYKLTISWKDISHTCHYSTFVFLGNKSLQKSSRALNKLNTFISKNKNNELKLDINSDKNLNTSNGQTSKQTPDDYIYSAKKLIEDQNYTKATEVCSKLLCLLPNSHEALFTRSIAWHFLGYSTKAMEDARKAAILGNQSAYNYLSNFYPEIFKELFEQKDALESKSDEKI